MSWILIATDGSDGAATAVRLAKSIPWPKQTVIGVVSVVPPVSDIVGMPWVPIVPTNAREIERRELRAAQEATWTAADDLRSAGLAAHCKVMRGEPADMLVRLAKRYRADLIIVGSRGLGTFQAALLGSVSAEVADRAPCPVLIARTDRIGTSIIADDGSPEAETARTFVQARPHLLGEATRLVGVVPAAMLWPDAMVPADPRTIETLLDARTAGRKALEDRLAADARELAAVGISATAEIRDGRAAGEIVAAAGATGAGLIVLGTHRRHGFQRLALGSVSRSVTHGAHGSVLIVRPPQVEAPAAEQSHHDEPTREPVNPQPVDPEPLDQAPAPRATADPRVPVGGVADKD